MKKIGRGSSIVAKNTIIGKNCVIGDNVIINVRGTFQIGNCSVIQDGTNITCQSFKAGEYLFMGRNVEIGRGGCTNPDANVIIGNHVGIFEDTVINPNSPITIGNDVGIGDGVMIWTHGVWLDITQGFPADFGPVTIGNNVWLPARTTVLPNVVIGDNVVIGIGSIVNKSVPNGSLAAGVPCKIIRENWYPKEVTDIELEKMVNKIMDRWMNVLVPAKGISDTLLNYNIEDKTITLSAKGFKNTKYDIINKTITGSSHDISEDFRDFLRRNGIKIYNGELFKSLPIL